MNKNVEKKLEQILPELSFRFAVTMPEIPHCYVVHTPQNDKAFRALFELIKEHGVWGTYYSKKYLYLYYKEYKYWLVSKNFSDNEIINRALVEDDK